LTNIRKELVLAIVQKYHPSSVADLKRRLSQEGIRSNDDDLLDVIRELQTNGAVTLQPFSVPGSFVDYVSDPERSWWIYLIMFSSALEALLVVENVQSGPVWILRLLLGLALLGLMPGYATVQILFPGDWLPLLEQALLSIFLSVMISIALGVALGAGYHFTGTSSVFALSIYTIVSVFVAGYRRFSQIRSRNLRSSPVS
jgi:uncharacterized protein DUF1616